MLTGFLALIVASYSSARFQAFWYFVRPFIMYVGILMVIGIFTVIGFQYIQHTGALEEQAKMERETKIRIEEDKARLAREKAALDLDLIRIQAENDQLKAKINNLPTAKQIIAHPRASAKVFNDTMNGQFRRFEEITK